MLGTGPVAALATLLRRPAFLIKSGLPVRAFLPTVVNILVAGLAGFPAHVHGTFGGGLVGGSNGSGLGALIDPLLGPDRSK